MESEHGKLGARLEGVLGFGDLGPWGGDFRDLGFWLRDADQESGAIARVTGQ